MQAEEQLAGLVVKNLPSLDLNGGDEALLAFIAKLEKPLVRLSKCPDYVVNRGHYFGTDKFTEEPALTDNDKRALIEFLKTF